MTNVVTDRQMSFDEIELSEEATKVINFKLEWYLNVGYSVKNAERLANDPNIDWHLAVKLRKQCSDEKLCMKILAPRKMTERAVHE